MAALVDRATNSTLIGPDWATNLEISDIVNNDPRKAKEILKAVKKRIGNKNADVKLLALTLLETLVKNCGDPVHKHVAEKGLLQELVKMVKKKPEYHVKEKILKLIDVWQEEFGGPRSKYPQYYATYQKLLRAGAVFPPRSEAQGSIYTSPRMQPLQNPPVVHATDRPREVTDAPVGSEHPALSLTEIQRAKGVVDLLSDILNALDPRDKSGLKQEIVLDLVGQSRSFKERVVRFVNTNTNEELLSQGLTLNDDLDRVLAKHDAIAAGIVLPLQPPGKSGESNSPNQALIQKRLSASSRANTAPPFEQLALPAPPAKLPSTEPGNVNPPMVDLLTGDDYAAASSADNSLALVLVNEPLPSHVSDPNLINMFAESNSKNRTPAAQRQSQYPLQTRQPLQQQQPARHPEGALHSSHHNNVNSRSRHLSYGTSHRQTNNYGATDQASALPPPPWEIQLAKSEQLQSGHFSRQRTVHTSPQPVQVGIDPSTGLPSQMVLVRQLVGAHPSGFAYPGALEAQHIHEAYYGGFLSTTQINQSLVPYHKQYGVPQQPNYSGNMPPQVYLQYRDFNMQGGPAHPYTTPSELSPRMLALSVQSGKANASLEKSSQPSVIESTSSSQKVTKSSKNDDNLFGDLLNMQKYKQNKPMVPRVASS